MSDYEFTTDWFSGYTPIWSQLVSRYKPARILEIGSYEGRAACFLIEQCAAQGALELHCVDSWQGGIEHDAAGMGDVERRFDRNIALARSKVAGTVDFHKHKKLSHPAMIDLLAQGRAGGFDLVYIDGSHQAPDVLLDAVLAFKLVKVGGLLIFDDYLWSMEGPGSEDSLNMPKPAIDAFINIFQRKVFVLRAPLYQLYVRKTAD